MLLGLPPDPSTYYITAVRIVLLKSWNIRGDICSIKNPGLVRVCQTASAGFRRLLFFFFSLLHVLFSVLAAQKHSSHSQVIIYQPARGQQLLFGLLSSLKLPPGAVTLVQSCCLKLRDVSVRSSRWSQTFNLCFILHQSVLKQGFLDAFQIKNY